MISVMERAEGVNPERIIWCCEQANISPADLATRLKIPAEKLQNTLRGEPGITIRQLQKIAKLFDRSVLFFLEPGPVQEEKVVSPQFRTITNKRPNLPLKIRTLIGRVSRHRDLYKWLLEESGEPLPHFWKGVSRRKLNLQSPEKCAASVRSWLGLEKLSRPSFEDFRGSVESIGVIVLLSNGYKGNWQIPKSDPIRGFSLFFEDYPVIFVKKQEIEAAQSFTLFHELGHLLLHRSSFIDDEADLKSSAGKEREASQFAGYLLVPSSYIAKIDLGAFPYGSPAQYSGFLKPYCQEWGVSTEMLLVRLSQAGVMRDGTYEQYKEFQQSLPSPKKRTGGVRYRYREPVRMFGPRFVGTVLDALSQQKITIPSASRYLDNIKLADIHQLERADVRS